MSDGYGYKILLEKKLINLPIVNTIAHLYKNSHIGIVNKVCDLYFNDTSQLDFRIKEVEEVIQQNSIVSNFYYEGCSVETHLEVVRCFSFKKLRRNLK